MEFENGVNSTPLVFPCVDENDSRGLIRGLETRTVG